MSGVRAQYEAFPYPERDPADEAKRLITGSPSDPREIDHVLFGGVRDWSVPFRALFAGGGTGDGLIQLAQMLTLAKRDYEITYLDLSEASRAVAEARARVRGLTGIRFETGSLLDAARYGQFDYIDCCGVLHHLPDPVAGLVALREALAPGGGLGFMVYAPLGRSGVYPLQAAFGAVLEGLAPAERLERARMIWEKIPAGHPIKTNPHLKDHEASDAGFYDLLLHSQDQAFDVASWCAALEAGGWALAGFCEPAAYDPTRFAPVPDGLSPVARMALAENLSGTMKGHVGYARPVGAVPPRGGSGRIPHLRGGTPEQIARAVAQGRELPLTRGGERIVLRLPREAAPVLRAVNGRRSLSQIAAVAKLDPIAFNQVWGTVERVLGGWGLMLYSNLLKG